MAGEDYTSPITGLTYKVPKYEEPADAPVAFKDFADSISSALLPNRNLLYNGAMQVWQRGTSISPGLDQEYTADRWKATQGGSSAWTVTRQEAGLQGFSYSLRHQRNSGDASAVLRSVSQALETRDVVPLQGKTVTISFYAKVGADFSASRMNVSVFNGTGTDQGPFVVHDGESKIINGPSDVTTSWQRFSFTGSFSETATSMRIEFSAQATGTAGTSDWFEITGVQLEVGETATSFEHKKYGTELAECQRYYYLHATGVGSRISVAAAYSSTLAIGILQFPVTMRTAPSAVVATGTKFYAFTRDSAPDFCNSLTMQAASTTTADLRNWTEISSTAGHAGFFEGNNANSSIAFSAEL